MVSNICTISRRALLRARALLDDWRIAEIDAYAIHCGPRTIVIDDTEAREDIIALDAGIADIDRALGRKPRRPQKYR